MFVDVYSYDEDDMVEDPYLAKHLAHFGINITAMQKVLALTFIQFEDVRQVVYVSFKKWV